MTLLSFALVAVLAIAAVIGWCGAVEANQRAKREADRADMAEADVDVYASMLRAENRRAVEAQKALAAERETGLSW